MKRRIPILIFTCLLSQLLFSENIKSLKPGGWVNDFAGVISQDYKASMEAVASEVKNKIGSELTVVTVKSMDGQDIETYATRLYETWGIGEKGKDNGALILLAIAERKIRIEVGYGLEPILPDGLTGGILDDYVMPDLRNGEYGLGLYRGLLKITEIVAKNAGIQIEGIPEVVQRPQSDEGSRERSSGGVVFLFILFIFLMIVTRGRILPWLLLGMLSGGGGKGGGFSSGGFGGGFGGFGGGSSGGGGASRGF